MNLCIKKNVCIFNCKFKSLVFFIKTWKDYEEFYEERFHELFNGTNVPNNLEDGAYMFDTVWAAALALRNVTAKLPSGQSLMDFNYSNAEISDMLYKEALNVSFFGLTVSSVVHIE